MEYLISFAESAPTVDGDLMWAEALEPKVYQTSQYGPIEVTNTTLQNFVSNFKSKVRGQDIALDYEHGMDLAKGKKAAGWFKDMQIRDGKLHLGIALTEPAKQEVKDGEWKYLSLDWDDFMDNDGTKHKDVVFGAALTNRPIAKGLASVPINFSEVVDESTAIKFSVWTTSYVDELPDSSFLHVESGGKKDASGKTTPRSMRHFPVKDANGKLDLPHLRDAIGRIPQSTAPGVDVKKLQSKARSLLSAKQMAEAGLVDDTFVEKVFNVNPEELMEPGTYAPDYTTGGYDDSAGNGWRIDTPPGGEDGTIKPVAPTVTGGENPLEPEVPPTSQVTDGGEQGMTPEEFEAALNEIRKLYAVGDDANIVEVVTAEHKEFSELKAAAAQISTSKKFSEEYPEEHRRMMEMETLNREQSAKLFSEQLAGRRVVHLQGSGDDAKEVPTNLGLSALALEKIQDTHKKFSEGTATIEDFTGVLDTVFKGGILEYGERGSAVSTPTQDGDVPTNVISIRRKFSEVVESVKGREGNKDMTQMQAVAVAANENPALFAAWRGQNPDSSDSATG